MAEIKIDFVILNERTMTACLFLESHFYLIISNVSDFDLEMLEVDHNITILKFFRLGFKVAGVSCWILK